MNWWSSHHLISVRMVNQTKCSEKQKKTLWYDKSFILCGKRKFVSSYITQLEHLVELLNTTIIFEEWLLEKGKSIILPKLYRNRAINGFMKHKMWTLFDLHHQLQEPLAVQTLCGNSYHWVDGSNDQLFFLPKLHHQ
jgi:hypothetical protein